jgi:hypothetical protein
LGVLDDKKIFGLKEDYNNLKNSKGEAKERGIFGKFFDRIIKDYFGESFSNSFRKRIY